jgi:hypothetical protein
MVPGSDPARQLKRSHVHVSARGGNSSQAQVPAEVVVIYSICDHAYSALLVGLRLSGQAAGTPASVVSTMPCLKAGAL